LRIFVLIPVHNRKDLTVQCTKDLIAQDTKNEIEIVIIDDGSTDGTNEALGQLEILCKSGLRRVEIIQGNGNWWWSRCIEEAIQYVKPRLHIEDRILFLNDDVRLNPNYCSTLISVNEKFGDCIVMSQLVDILDGSIIDSPISVLSDTLEIRALPVDHSTLGSVSKSDVAPGRGTLYPAGLFLHDLNVDRRRLPHYLSDYEFSVRAKRTGLDILCSHDSKVFTAAEWGNSRRITGLIRRFAAVESPQNLRAYWTFWRTWEPHRSKLILLVKIIRYRLIPTLGTWQKLK
jgi:GT2 family glycosyltransferase